MVQPFQLKPSFLNGHLASAPAIQQVDKTCLLTPHCVKTLVEIVPVYFCKKIINDSPLSVLCLFGLDQAAHSVQIPRIWISSFYTVAKAYKMFVNVATCQKVK